MNLIKRSLTMIAICAFVGTAFTQCSTEKESANEVSSTAKTTIDKPETKKMQDTPDIVGVAAGNDDFSTLVAAVKAAELVEALQGDGPFTVFAPTNEAFDGLPEGTVENLLKPENKEMLTAILTYHVVPAKLDAAAVLGAIKEGGGKATVETLQGGMLTATVVDGAVVLTDENGSTSTVVKTDVMASNGVIHVIDTVVTPK